MADNMGDNQGAICKKQRMDKLIAQSDYMVVIQDGKKSHEDDKVMLTSKQSWTIAEDQQLLQLVEHYGPQWTRIAQYFPTRDRKRCRERYVNHVDPTLLHTKWSNDEEKQVQKLYQQFGTKWTCIASHMIGRSPDEVKNHILAISLRKKRLESMQKINSCNDRQLPKKWSTNESKLLQQLVATHGAKNWLFIASHIENRTDLQCMQRWYRVLNPSLVKGRGSWTSAEDEILQHKVTQLGKKWSMVRSTVVFFCSSHFHELTACCSDCIVFTRPKW